MDPMVARAAANCAGAYREWAARTGHRTALWPDLSVADQGVPNSAPVDSACLLAPAQDTEAMADVVDRAEAVFARSEGGPVQIWSAWPTPDLTARGYTPYQVPWMMRPADRSQPPTPEGLRIQAARDEHDLRSAALLIDAVFGVGARDPSGLVTADLIDDDLEVFVGYVEERAVATATAYVSDGFCGVYAVATAPEARGRGYGEALSRAATLFRADLPATLQASPMGYPIYSRMGFRTYGEFTLWEGPRPRRGG